MARIEARILTALLLVERPYAFSWAVPFGLSHKAEAGEQRIYLSGAQAGEYRVEVKAFRNGEPGQPPVVIRGELIVVVETGPLPLKPIGVCATLGDEVAHAGQLYPALVAEVQRLTGSNDPDVRAALVPLYLEMAGYLRTPGGVTPKDLDAHWKTKFAASAAHGLPAAQALVSGINPIVNKYLHTVRIGSVEEMRSVYLATVAALGYTCR